MTCCNACGHLKMRLCTICRDLRAGAPDSPNCLWRAEGNETCALSLSRPPAAAPASAAASRGPGQSTARAADGRSTEVGPAALAAWAQGAGCLLRQLHERVCVLLSQGCSRSVFM